MTSQAPESLPSERFDDGSKRAETGGRGESVSFRRSFRTKRDAHPETKAPQTWLTDRVETSRRAAKEQPCRKCGTRVLVGPDDDDCSITARVDLTPASLLEEVVARLSGRFSCELRRGRLYHRDDFRIRARRNENPILLDHKCETTVLF